MSSDHIERLEEGGAVALFLGIIGIILAGVKLLWDHILSPHSGAIVSGLLVCAGIVVALYIIGYIVRDLPDDIKEWIGDE